MAYRQENGRTYHSYKDGGEFSTSINTCVKQVRVAKPISITAYVLPNDEVSLTNISKHRRELT